MADVLTAEILTAARALPAVRAALDRPDAEIATYDVAEAAHVVDNMTTAGLHQVSGTLTDGASWRVFAKVLHPASSSLLMAFVPPEVQPAVLQHLNWLDEPRFYRSGLAEDLPGGIRLPRVFAIDEVGDERIVIWMEQVDDRAVWDLDGYRRAARSLGRLSGRWSEARVTSELGIARRDLGFLFFGKLSNFDIPALRSEDLWADPVLASVVDGSFRADLERLIAIAPGLVMEEPSLPHGLAHGDASPHNLLLDDAGEVVAIDWGFGCAGPFGSDLGQLLAGRFDMGHGNPVDIPAVADEILPAYLEGLADEGVHPDPALVRRAWAIHLAIRSSISAAVLGPQTQLDDEARRFLLASRVAVARIGLDLVLGGTTPVRTS